MAQIKTNNSYLRDKIDLRINHLPPGAVRVLDCYSGRGLLWKGIIDLTKRDIITLPIDILGDMGFHLQGKNQGFLMTLDLTKYNVIDLDAYGVPYEQLKIIFDRGYHGVVFVTFIQSLYGQMPIALLEELGFTEAMTKRIPTLFGRRGWEYFLEYLALHGVKEVSHRSISRKHYLSFKI